MRPLLYSINVTVDGCVHHNAVPTDEVLLQDQLRATHRHATESIGRADALLFGRTIYQMMESAWRLETLGRTLPDWQEPFARTIDAMKKYVVSSTLDRVGWNAELVRGNLDEAVRKLKQQPGRALFTGGVKLPLALAELDLIDEYEFVVQPRIAGHGPTPFAGLSKYVELKLVDRRELSSGAVALRYEPRR
jgi:dihydrofolate reductase